MLVAQEKNMLRHFYTYKEAVVVCEMFWVFYNNNDMIFADVLINCSFCSISSIYFILYIIRTYWHNYISILIHILKFYYIAGFFSFLCGNLYWVVWHLHSISLSLSLLHLFFFILIVILIFYSYIYFIYLQQIY